MSEVWQPGDIAGLAERIAAFVAHAGGPAYGESVILNPIVNAIDKLAEVGNRAKAWETARAALAYALLQGWLRPAPVPDWADEDGAYEATDAWELHLRKKKLAERIRRELNEALAKDATPEAIRVTAVRLLQEETQRLFADPDKVTLELSVEILPDGSLGMKV